MKGAPSPLGLVGGALSAAQAALLSVLVGPALVESAGLVAEGVPDVVHELGRGGACVAFWAFLLVLLLVLAVIALFVLALLVVTAVALVLPVVPAWRGEPLGQGIGGAANLLLAITELVVLVAWAAPLGIEWAYPLLPLAAGTSLLLGAAWSAHRRARDAAG